MSEEATTNIPTPEDTTQTKVKESSRHHNRGPRHKAPIASTIQVTLDEASVALEQG